jgi:hypothetical protein
MKISVYIIGGVIALFLICLIISVIYQGTRSNTSITEVNRNISLPEGSKNELPLSILSYSEIQNNYSELNDDQWKEYAKSILGTRVSWSGTISAVENRRVEVDMGTTPLRYLILMGLSDSEKADLSIGDTIEFEGRIQSFHLVKGMNTVLDFVQIR